jgi:hypothetical protein
MKMRHQVGVSLVLTGSLQVSIITVRGGRLTGMDLTAMTIIVIQIEAVTTRVKSNLLSLPPGMFFQAGRQSPLLSPSPGNITPTRITNIRTPTVRARGLVISTNHRTRQQVTLNMTRPRRWGTSLHLIRIKTKAVLVHLPMPKNLKWFGGRPRRKII